VNGWQAVCTLLIGAAVACVLAMTGHEQTAMGIGGSMVTGVFTLLVQHRREKNGHSPTT